MPDPFLRIQVSPGTKSLYKALCAISADGNMTARISRLVERDIEHWQKTGQPADIDALFDAIAQSDQASDAVAMFGAAVVPSEVGIDRPRLEALAERRAEATPSELVRLGHAIGQPPSKIKEYL